MVAPQELPQEFIKLTPTNDPFVKLVPFAVHEHLTKYNELKREFVANEFALFEQANETLKVELQKMGLPGSIEALEQPKGGIPPSLQEKVRVIQQEGGEKHIIELLAAKANLANFNSQLISEALNVLDNEEADDNEMRNRFGISWTRTPSHTLTVLHRQEAAKFQANLQHAIKSDAIVENKFKQIQLELRKLGGSVEEISSLLPQTMVGAQSSNANSTYVPELQKCMKAIDSIIAARLQLQQNLKTKADNDNITNSLLESLKPPESLFEEELKKYQQEQQLIRDNIEKQKLQLEVTKKLNDAWNQTKNSDQSAKMREQALQRLDQVYQQYLQLKANLKEGIEFYTNIQEVITKFKRKCEDLAFARQTEKQELTMHLISSQQGGSQQAPPPSGGESYDQPLYIQQQNQPQFPTYTNQQQRPNSFNPNQQQQNQKPPPYNPNQQQNQKSFNPNQQQQNRYAPFPNNNQQQFSNNNQQFVPNNQFNPNQQQRKNPQFNPNQQQFNQQGNNNQNRPYPGQFGYQQNNNNNFQDDNQNF